MTRLLFSSSTRAAKNTIGALLMSSLLSSTLLSSTALGQQLNRPATTSDPANTQTILVQPLQRQASPIHIDDLQRGLTTPDTQAATLVTNAQEPAAEALEPIAQDETQDQPAAGTDSVEPVATPGIDLQTAPAQSIVAPTDNMQFQDRKASFADGHFKLPNIRALTTRQDQIGNGVVPIGVEQLAEASEIPLPESPADRAGQWQWNSYAWKAPNTFHHPLYFEDRMLERHGHQRHPAIQPLVSSGRMAAQIVLLPYLATINPPCECQYTLGYYRAGSCVPRLKQRAPYQRRAALLEAAAIIGFIAAVP